MRDHDHYADADIRGLLERVKTIAVVGASDDPSRASNEVMRYLARRGYRMVAVNPKLAGGTIDGIPVFGALADIPTPVDMIDIFRNNAAVPGVVDEVLAMPHRPSAVWMQLGVRVDSAARQAEAAGIEVVMNRCPKIEIARLMRD